MTTQVSEFDEIRAGIERLRGMLENLIVRGLRACGEEELLQLQSFTEYLERAGAGHVAAVLGRLHSQIAADDRASARTLLTAQTAVRLLERLLTLKVVAGQYRVAVELLNAEAAGAGDIGSNDETDDEAE
jgi:hypothetical protein